MTLEHLTALLAGWQDGAGPLYLRLAGALRVLAERGTVCTGIRLPSERALAAALHVSRNTVTTAYGRLRDDGWLVGGRGTVARVGAVAPRTPGGDETPDDPLAGLFPPGRAPRLDLTLADPDAAPAVLDGLAQPRLLLPSPAAHASGYHPAGHPVLLEAIARKLRGDGIDAHPEEIVVTNGAQQALALAAEVLYRPRRPFAVEAVTYPGIIDAVRRRGRGQLIALPVEDSGLEAEAAARLIRATSPAAVFLTAFHNPTGYAVDRNGADALLTAAQTAGSAIVEDRVLADLPLDGQGPPVPLAALRPGTAVLTVGSLSKVFWGGLRIGWIHTNRTLAAHLRVRRRALDLGSAAPMQLLAAWLLDQHYRETRQWRIARLRSSLAALTGAISAADLGWRYRVPKGGPNLWVRLPRPVAQSFAGQAAQGGVPIAAGATFAATPGMAGEMIRIPFFPPPEELTAAVDLLAAIWRRQTQQAKRPLLR
ncbi:PLP-dependent aminotransferase family protein [Nonomuraea rosea]|uniref:PLP-dependent aminotransferase family protein n=2 Tax=Nonomuraea rosea TaxID=638574 RepID=A0ABP6ZC70_9ACTN